MKTQCRTVFVPLDLPKNTLLPKELLWRLTRYSNVLQDILPGGVGPGQISKTLSTDALSLKCHHALKDSSAQKHRLPGFGGTLNVIFQPYSCLCCSFLLRPREPSAAACRRGPRLCRVPACCSRPEFLPSMDAPCSPGPHHSDGCYNYIQKGDQT